MAVELLLDVVVDVLLVRHVSGASLQVSRRAASRNIMERGTKVRANARRETFSLCIHTEALPSSFGTYYSPTVFDQHFIKGLLDRQDKRSGAQNMAMPCHAMPVTLSRQVSWGHRTMDVYPALARCVTKQSCLLCCDVSRMSAGSDLPSNASESNGIWSSVSVNKHRAPSHTKWVKPWAYLFDVHCPAGTVAQGMFNPGSEVSSVRFIGPGGVCISLSRVVPKTSLLAFHRLAISPLPNEATVKPAQAPALAGCACYCERLRSATITDADWAGLGRNGGEVNGQSHHGQRGSLPSPALPCLLSHVLWMMLMMMWKDAFDPCAAHELPIYLLSVALSPPLRGGCKPPYNLAKIDTLHYNTNTTPSDPLY
ncbi:uncharacterized protein MYCFIDRAFT_175304 [Pseudocercospora fijiensis CIRAD86]|uniref:Uncharacterized protein n=1 Tax=Pseudocercospora fijiensis (strain CIRAD86) TaxID=383855 RepID=M2YVI5_PSEFD|nr:uncharacterized protein MYCFIDRAFT_175304 [Pseudocercospora fijiensis CIRAD86]EME81715.1 hypothetical protein MYCFIDRAFT_175304 [Pseudocercospora fijiensis CIRAD86]